MEKLVARGLARRSTGRVSVAQSVDDPMLDNKRMNATVRGLTFPVTPLGFGLRFRLRV